MLNIGVGCWMWVCFELWLPSYVLLLLIMAMISRAFSVHSPSSPSSKFFICNVHPAARRHMTQPREIQGRRVPQRLPTLYVK